MRVPEVIMLVFMLCCCRATAQNYASYNSYPVNPALYNPAEVLTPYTYVFVNHRQQWMNIEGAPELTTINLHTRFNRSRGGIGARASSFTRGVLTTSDVMLTYAYGIPVNEKSAFHFGLSAGAITSTIDLTDANADDPAVVNYMANNIQPAGSFGMLFKSGAGLNFGIALPQLLAPKFNSTANFEHTAFSPVDNVVVSMYFKRKVEGKIVTRRVKGVRRRIKQDDAYAPLELYALYKYSAAGNNQFEVTGKFNLSQNFWLGASYRQGYGLAGMLGFGFDRFSLAYSYEPGNQPEPAFSLGTHELQIGLRLGQEKESQRPAPELRSLLKAPVTQKHSARFQHDEHTGTQEAQQGPKKKYYVVVRSFADFAAADTYRAELVEEKYNANIFYNPKDRKYHVHVFETTKSSDAFQEARNLKNYTKLKRATVLTVTEK